jgi:hypothetical protein
LREIISLRWDILQRYGMGEGKSPKANLATANYPKFRDSLRADTKFGLLRRGVLRALLLLGLETLLYLLVLFAVVPREEVVIAGGEERPKEEVLVQLVAAGEEVL